MKNVFICVINRPPYFGLGTTTTHLWNWAVTVRRSLPSLPDVEQVSHHPQQHLCGADGIVVICRHLVANQVLALLCCQLLAFTEGIDVDEVVDVVTPAALMRRMCKCLSLQTQAHSCTLIPFGFVFFCKSQYKIFYYRCE